MVVSNLAYIGVGVMIGAGVVFYQTDIPKDHVCETYKVVAKPVTAYVLKPPPAETIYRACPQVTQITQKIEEAKAEEPVVEEEKPRRRHRRHHRIRKYWR